MDKQDIADGITLFRYSGTAQRSPRAAEVVRALNRLYNSGEIGFFNDRVTLRGVYSHEDDDGADLTINMSFIETFPKVERLAALSVELAHEGTHAALHDNATFKENDLLDELAARTLQLYYYRELTGPGVFNEAEDKPGRSGHIYRLSPTRFKFLESQSHWLRADRLIDYMLAYGDSYRTKRYLNPQWVISHLNLWGGIANRKSATKGLYCAVLATSTNFHFTPRIVEIMESINTPSGWDKLIARADTDIETNEIPGQLPALRATLAAVAHDAAWARRIEALETRWRTPLRTP